MTVSPRDAAPPRFAVVVVVTWLVVQGFGVVSPALPVISRERGLDAAAAGLLLSAFALGRLLFSLPGGMLADRYGFRTVAVATSTGVAACAVVAATTSSFGVLLLAQFGQGVGSAVFTTAAMTLVLRTTPGHATGRALGRFQAAVVFGLSASPLLGGAAVELFGGSGPFWACAVGGAIGAVLSVVALPSGAGPVRAATGLPIPGRVPRALLMSRPLLLANLVALASFWAVGGIRNTLVPLFAEEEFGLAPVATGAMLAAAAIANVVAVMPAGRLADEAGRQPVIRVGMLAIAASTLAMAPVRHAWLLAVAVTVAGAAKGIASVAPLAVVADVAPPAARGAAVGVSRTASELGLVLGPVTLAALAGAVGTRAAVAVAGGMLLVVTGAAWAIPETLRPRPAADDERVEETCGLPAFER